MKFAKIISNMVNEGRYSQSPIVGSIFHDSSTGAKYYIEKISGDKVTARTFTVTGPHSIILDKHDVDFSTSTLEMRGALDVISFEKGVYSNVMTQKEYDDSIKAEKKRLKAIADDEKRETRRQAAKDKPISKSKYNKILKDMMSDAENDGTAEHTFDLANSLAHNPDVSKYAKYHYGHNWQQNVQWDLESFL